MNQVHFDPKLYALPSTQLILATHLDGKVNFMALAWATRVNSQPPLIAIGVNKNHMSNMAITKNKQFGLCMPSVEMVAQTDYVGLVSARKTNKSEVFDVFYGGLHDAPLIKQCPLNLEMELYEHLEMPTNTLFIGEIKGAWCNEDFLVDGKPDIAQIKPFILTMPDNRYWGIGDQVGQAWSAGKTMKK